MTTNRQWLIDGNPRGRALLLSDFMESDEPLTPLNDGEVRIKVEVLSFEPSQKGQLEVISGYSSGGTNGAVMGARGIGEVVESKDSGLHVGDKVLGALGWQEFATLSSSELQVLPDDEMLTAHLGPLGAQGLTAYFGLLRIGKPEVGDTVMVSGAAGAVGSVVGQIAKISGCRVIGSAGGEEKVKWLKEIGFDAAIDYKSEKIKSRITEVAPKGINVFFDNVGGQVLNDVLVRIASHARVVICGAISRYEQESLPAGPANYFNVVFRQAKIEGFLLRGYESDYEEAIERLRGWLESGEIIHREDIQHGFENIPATLKRLFEGANIGKQLLKL
ncbi:MAG: NADP-dependent oxidoreductase [Gammaproteobacteria bacterium]|nr:NADP-dependent oxidoreductase [Gammaproteobacteria bacterium]